MSTNKDAREIRLIKSYIGKEEWSKDIPELVYTLKYGYDFYYSKNCQLLYSDMSDTLHRNSFKHKHKMGLYFDPAIDIYYFVIYKKNTIDVYTLEKYSGSKHRLTRYRTAQTWMAKMDKKYDIAAQKKENEQYGEIQQLQGKVGIDKRG